jgi:hypothetical protein
MTTVQGFVLSGSNLMAFTFSQPNSHIFMTYLVKYREYLPYIINGTQEGNEGLLNEFRNQYTNTVSTFSS